MAEHFTKNSNQEKDVDAAVGAVHAILLPTLIVYLKSKTYNQPRQKNRVIGQLILGTLLALFWIPFT